MFASDIGDGPTWLVGLEISDVRIGGGGHEESWVEGLGVMGNGESLAGAEAMEGATDFGVAWGEASGDEEGGVGGAGGAGGKEWAWGGGTELAEEGEGFFWGGGVGDEEGRERGGGGSYILGNVGGSGGGERERRDGEGGGGGGGGEGEPEEAEGLHGFGQLAGAGYADGDLSHGMKDSLFLGISSTGSALIAAESEIKKEGGEEGGGEAGSKKEKNRGNMHITNEDGGGNIRDKE